MLPTTHTQCKLKQHIHSGMQGTFSKPTPVPLRYTATVLSRLTDSSHRPSGENCSCVTVRLCAVREPSAAQVEVSHSHTAAVLLVWALQADASRSPEGDAATQNSSAPCPYSLATSGHRLLCARCSSSGGPAAATPCCVRMCTHMQHTVLSSYLPVMQSMPVSGCNNDPKFGSSYFVTAAWDEAPTLPQLHCYEELACNASSVLLPPAGAPC